MIRAGATRTTSAAAPTPTATASTGAAAEPGSREHPEGRTMSSLFAEFTKCRKPDCRRKVKLSVAYCCGACAEADGERAFELEPYSPLVHPFLCHSEDCEQRNAERGEVSVSEL